MFAIALSATYVREVAPHSIRPLLTRGARPKALHQLRAEANGVTLRNAQVRLFFGRATALQNRRGLALQLRQNVWPRGLIRKCHTVRAGSIISLAVAFGF